MKLLAFLLLFSANLMAQDNFVELRLGLQDSYSKKVMHATKGTLQGDFKGFNYGLRYGRNFGEHQVFLELNPNQSVEIKSANELAKVNSYFIGYHYFIYEYLYIGGQIGHSSFELEKGPNGVTFTDNPKTSGLTYGFNVGYKYNFNKEFHLSYGLAYNLGNYKKDGPTTTPVNSIEIKSQYQINLNVGYSF